MAQRRNRQLSGIVIWKEGLLRTILADHLSKIALLVEQPHADHRHAQITGGFELIARHVTQPARINGESFAQHVFHAEIGDTGQGRLRMMVLKPCRRLRRLPPGLYEVINALTESGIR